MLFRRTASIVNHNLVPRAISVFKMTQNGDGPGDEIDSKNKMAELDCLPASSELILWLARNKLDCYHQSFIEKGYDDLEEIIQMSDDLLTQLANDVGMIENQIMFVG